MRKRILSALLVVGLLAGAVMPVSASATEVMEDGDVDVQVTYDIPSSYVINIPTTIDLTGLNTYTFTAQMVSIPDNKEVSIYAPTDGVRMTNEYGNSGTMYIRAYGVEDARVAAFGRGELTSKFPMCGQLDEIS